ncbi:hypothetical protein [Tolypothrix sp. VBCCA 56010]|uniref:hypothetical protein n=1 Tax=Tolypothrix sp. VBCCA 56010 TaxID=3137731 RepID=UPI003D7DDB7F
MDAKKPANKAGKRREHKPLDATLKAIIWNRLEEGQTRVQIAKELRISTETIWKVTKEDPVKYESIRMQLKEDRAARWREINIKTLQHTQALVDLIGRKATKRGRLDERDQGDLTARAAALRTLRSVAGDSLKAYELLTGGATERIESQVSTNAADMPPDQLIELAIAENDLSVLPVQLREVAKKRMEAKKDAHKADA